MDDTDIKKFIITQLGKHHNPNEITKEVCERTGMRWDDAQKFIKQVYAENREEIVGRQSGIIIALSVLIIISGVVVSGGVLVATLSGWVVLFLRLPIPYLGNLVYFLLGIAMIMGGIRGFENLKNSK
jgi:uncharacterized membrane protein